MEESTFAQDIRMRIETDLSDSVKAAVAKAEEFISQLGGQAEEQAHHEIEQVFSDCEQRIHQISLSIRSVIDENSAIISERINQAITEKAKQTASSLVDNISTEAVNKAEGLIIALPQKIKEQAMADKLLKVSKIDFAMAKAAAELKEQQLENKNDNSSQAPVIKKEAQNKDAPTSANTQAKQEEQEEKSASKGKDSDKESEVNDIITFFS
jgi:hypothetical protein